MPVHCADGLVYVPRGNLCEPPPTAGLMLFVLIFIVVCGVIAWRASR